MILADYLTAHARAWPQEPGRMLGETGFSMPDTFHPHAAFRRWASDQALPPRPGLLLEQGLYLSRICGLVRAVPAGKDGIGFESVWILGRSDQGLISMVVRNAVHADVGRLHEDAELALKQAARYLAGHAVVLVQACGRGDRKDGYRRFAQDLGCPPEQLQHLYAARHARTGVMLACAWLEPETE